MLLLHELGDRQDARLVEPRRHDLQSDRQADRAVMPAGTLPAGRLTSVTRNAGAIQST